MKKVSKLFVKYYLPVRLKNLCETTISRQVKINPDSCY